MIKREVIIKKNKEFWVINENKIEDWRDFYGDNKVKD